MQQPEAGFAWTDGAGLEAGDVFVAANATEQPADMRAGLKGWGRILHCDAALRPKAELRTGDYGLVIGLLLDSKRRRLYASSPQLSKLSCYDIDARAPATAKFPPRRRYGNMCLDGQGRILIGVHSGHGEPTVPDGHGDGKLVRFDPDSGAAEFFDVEIDGGRGGKHFVSNLALAPDGRTVFYVSEAGRRVLRYDIEARRQLEDFAHIAEADGGTYGLDVATDGRVIMAMGKGAGLFAPDGAVLRRYEVSADKGWTRAKLCAGQRSFVLGNFIEGLLQRRDVEHGEVEHELNVGLKGSLATAVDFAPEGGA